MEAQARLLEAQNQKAMYEFMMRQQGCGSGGSQPPHYGAQPQHHATQPPTPAVAPPPIFGATPWHASTLPGQLQTPEYRKVAGRVAPSWEEAEGVYRSAQPRTGLGLTPNVQMRPMWNACASSAASAWAGPPASVARTSVVTPDGLYSAPLVLEDQQPVPAQPTRPSLEHCTDHASTLHFK